MDFEELPRDSEPLTHEEEYCHCTIWHCTDWHCDCKK